MGYVTTFDVWMLTVLVVTYSNVYVTPFLTGKTGDRARCWTRPASLVGCTTLTPPVVPHLGKEVSWP